MVWQGIKKKKKLKVNVVDKSMMIMVSEKNPRCEIMLDSR